MRRMYSEKELTEIIKVVSKEYIDELLEDGYFDDDIVSAVNAYLDENPITPSDLDFSSIDFVAKTLKQSQPNAVIDFSFTSIPTGFTKDEAFVKLQEINGVLYAIACLTLTNTDENPHTIGEGYGFIASSYVQLPESIAEKVFDIDGKSVHEASLAENTLITSAPLFVHKAKISSDSLAFVEARMTLANRTSINYLAVQLVLNGGQSNRLTVNAGESIYITGRIALTLF